MLPIALSIAGSDPSGGAGIQADLKTFHQFGAYGQAVITLLTVQNTLRVSHVEMVRAELVEAQLQAVLEDIPPHAAKTGALGNREIVETVARLAASFRFPLVVDPVMISKHGSPLMDREAEQALKRSLLPLAALITPNLPEAEALTGISIGSEVQMRDAARALQAMGAKAVLIKGGHLAGRAADLLLSGEFHVFAADRIDTIHTHGTGCTLSAAITALLARNDPIESAVATAKRYVNEAIRTNPGLGGGSGPVNHFASATPAVP